MCDLLIHLKEPRNMKEMVRRTFYTTLRHDKTVGSFLTSRIRALRISVMQSLSSILMFGRRRKDYLRTSGVQVIERPVGGALVGRRVL